MYNSWALINSKLDIPISVLEHTLRITENRLVVDFGCGLHKGDHIDFMARHITRWDVTGVVCCNQKFQDDSLYEIITRNNEDKFIVIFYRVISVMNQEKIKELKELLNVIRPRLDYVIVLDYLYNKQRSSEYSYIDGIVGRTASVEVEWWEDRFYHYTENQLEAIIGSTILFKQNNIVPAVKRNNDSASFCIFKI